jgi:hypothetical protein
MADDKRDVLDYAKPRSSESSGWEPLALWALWGIVVVCLLRLVYGALTSDWN